MGRPLTIVLLVASLAVQAVPGEAGTAPHVLTSRVPRFGRVPSERLLAARLEDRRGSAPAPGPVAMPSGTAQPLEVGEFDAIQGDPAISPSDSTGAVGPAHILTAVNIEFALWDRAATDPATALMGPTPLAALFPGLPDDAFVFDPKVVYDPYRERFVLVFLAGHGVPFTGGRHQSWILIVSMPQATATTPQSWCRWKLDGDQVNDGTEVFADYPGVGFDADRLYVSTNQFRYGFAPAFRHAQILALRKGALYGCHGDPVIEAFGGSQTRDPEGTKAFTIQPAVTATEDGIEPPGFLVSFQSTGCGGLCGSRMTLWRIEKEAGGLVLDRASVKVGNARMPPLGTQKDGSVTCSPITDCWDTGDLRLTTAFYDADRTRLYTGHAVRRNIGAGDGYLESAIRWYGFDPKPFHDVRLARKGIIGGSRTDAGWPAMATDGAGNLLVSYSRASAVAPVAEYLSAVAAAIPPGSTGDSVVVLKQGEARFDVPTGQPQRWGDYNALSRDPLDPSLVVSVNQYAEDDGSPPSTRLWRQVVHTLTVT